LASDMYACELFDASSSLPPLAPIFLGAST
jgi:hypothetical protein